MKKLLFILIALSCLQVQARGKYDNTDTLVVAHCRGSGGVPCFHGIH